MSIFSLPSKINLGESGLKYISNIKDFLITSSSLLNSSIEKVPNSIQRIQKENDSLKLKLSSFEKKATKSLADKVLSDCESFNDIKIVSYLGKDMTSSQLKSLWDDLKKNESVIAILASNNKESSIIICAAGSQIQNFDCKLFLSKVATNINGKGGGKSNLAQFGCDTINSLDEIVMLIKSQL